MVERSGIDFPVHGPASGLDQFAFLHIGPDGKLPVRSGLRLRHDVLRVPAVRNDFAGDFERAVLDGRRHHADAGVGLVFVIGQQRHRVRDLHPGEVDHHREFPSRQIHLPAAVGESRDLRPAAAGRLYEREFTHHLPSPAVRNPASSSRIPRLTVTRPVPRQSGCRASE
ncbi:hypothetical protein SDC9_165309 [bioreactor metagenome]|uniref:Uncharacterized protein n=1 Tax=bioreactor metagenome TaxID=1076179 RepID=A0A645FU00_9ZZZZ